MDERERTRGGLRYSTVLMLRALREELMISFTRLYRSTLKLSVGPADSRTMRIEGATSVTVNASRWVTPSAGAIVRKSFSLFLVRSFTCSIPSQNSASVVMKTNRLTFSRLAVLGSITLRTSRTSCVRECPTCPCLITNDFGTPSAVPGLEAAPPLRCVRFLRFRAISARCVRKGQRGIPSRRPTVEKFGREFDRHVPDSRAGRTRLVALRH